MARPQSIHRVAMATFWRTFHHEGKIRVHHEGGGGGGDATLRGQIRSSYFSFTLFSSVGAPPPPLPQYRMSLEIIYPRKRLHPALKSYDSSFFPFYVMASIQCKVLTIGLFIVYTAPLSHVYPPQLSYAETHTGPVNDNLMFFPDDRPPPWYLHHFLGNQIFL
jgi:hypothetical protein